VQKLRDRISRWTGLASVVDRITGAGAATPLTAAPGNGAAAGDHAPPAAPPAGASVGAATVARGFAWMFSGAKLPAPRLLDLLLGTGD
jgi:hypothetical protein